MEKTFVVTYKGGKGKGFAQTEKLIKATTKKEARGELYKLVPNAIVKNITQL
ncbi:hypothetical protein D3C80_2190950 [compost metagenome]